MLAMIRISEMGLIFLGGLFMYFVGGIPFGLLVGKLKGVDVRKAGSGNIGATNVGRLCGRPWGILVLALDAAKGFAPCLWLAPWVGRQIIPEVPFPDVVMQVAFGVGAVAGHMWPVYLGFRGGKGVATTAGVFLAVAPWALLCAFVTWVVFTAATKYVSVGSIMSVIALASGQMLCYPSTAFRDRLGVTIFVLAVALIVIVKHRSNILRLIQGKENRISFGKKKAPEGEGAAAPS